MRNLLKNCTFTLKSPNLPIPNSNKYTNTSTLTNAAAVPSIVLFVPGHRFCPNFFPIMEAFQLKINQVLTAASPIPTMRSPANGTMEGAFD